MKKPMVIVIILCMLLISACGVEPQKGQTTNKIPANLRADNVQFVADEGILFCFFYVNYYSESAEFLVALSDGEKAIEKAPMVQKDGSCEVWLDEIEKLSVENQMELTLQVKEGDEQKSIGVAKEIVISRKEDPGKWDVTFRSSTNQ